MIPNRAVLIGGVIIILIVVISSTSLIFLKILSLDMSDNPILYGTAISVTVVGGNIAYIFLGRSKVVQSLICCMLASSLLFSVLRIKPKVSTVIGPSSNFSSQLKYTSKQSVKAIKSEQISGRKEQTGTAAVVAV